MEKIIIEVEQGKYTSAKEVRLAKKLPMIYYGKGVEPIQMTTDYQNFRRAFRQGGRSSIFTLKTQTGNLQALVHEVQYHPVTDEMIHVDLMAVKEGQTIHAEVPLVFVGESPAVKDLGGVLLSNRDHVMVECMPKDLPHDIQVDISGLMDFHSHLSVSDIQVPKGVKILDAMDINIVSVAATREEKEEPVTPSASEASAAPASPEKKE